MIEPQTTKYENIAQFAAKVQAALSGMAEVPQPQRRMVLLVLGMEAIITVDEVKIVTGTRSEAEVLNLCAMGRAGQIARAQIPISVAIEQRKRKEIVID